MSANPLIQANKVDTANALASYLSFFSLTLEDLGKEGPLCDKNRYGLHLAMQVAIDAAEYLRDSNDKPRKAKGGAE